MNFLAKQWDSLPTEFQTTMIFAGLIVICWFAQLLSPVLVSSFSTVTNTLLALAGGNLIHGGCSRIFGKGDTAKDMIGDANG